MVMGEAKSLSFQSGNITYLMILIDKVIGFVRVRASNNCHYMECMSEGFGAILKIDPKLRRQRQHYINVNIYIYDNVMQRYLFDWQRNEEK